jgi:hypothetical protein
MDIDPTYLDEIAERADAIARAADDSWMATKNKQSRHTSELARLVVALATHLRDDEPVCWGCEEDDQPGMLIKLVPGCPIHDKASE